MTQPPWGWGGTVREFLATSEDQWVASLLRHHALRLSDLELSAAQIEVWEETHRLCMATLSAAVRVEPLLADCLLAAEYELPGEAGRRPDVVIVTPTGHLFVLEFKSQKTPLLSDYDQVLGYVRDLTGYHSLSYNLTPHPFLILTRGVTGSVSPASHSSVTVDTPDSDVLLRLKESIVTSLRSSLSEVDPIAWLDGDYAPLPSLITAAVEAFRNNELPAIKTTRHLHDLVGWLHGLVRDCEKDNRYALVLITGAPGSGKTLVGLQTVADEVHAGRQALYLSGNGPLVGVLLDCINRLHVERAAKTMIRGMMDFKKNALTRPRYAPANVYVFDEGQRAWNQVKNYHGSEVQLLLEVAERKPWGVVVGLIGEGQDIYQHEEGDLATWFRDYQATKLRGPWTIYSPVRVEINEPCVEVRTFLHLDKSVRSKQILSLHKWVNGLLAGLPGDGLATLAGSLHNGGFPVYLTHSRSVAEEYVRALYEDAVSKRFGWVASSACKQSRRNPIGLPQIRQAHYYQLEQVYGGWYNDPVGNDRCSNTLREACSEFGCQGLELDFTLVFWGDDLVWDGADWRVRSGVRLKGGKPREHTLNAYRVLLTRAREGMVIWCPDHVTHSRLHCCGVQQL